MNFPPSIYVGMSVPGVTGPRQLGRQAGWLAEHWQWLLDTEVLPSLPPRPSALDVGAGPGVVAAALSSRLNITCLDIDPAAAEACRARGLRAAQGDAHCLPFPDRSFDVAYCSFVLLWLNEPLQALQEMLRVSRHAVLLLAEPDHGGRIDHPESLCRLKDLIITGMRREGADPLMGRKLRQLCSACGMDARIGIHPGAWDLRRLREESEAEWEWISSTAGEEASRLRKEWDDALARGTLFQHNPVFYALLKK